jgi:predicted RNase H-like nuclease (RuvC/YqgF family)
MNGGVKKIDQSTLVPIGSVVGIAALVLTNAWTADSIAKEARNSGRYEATMSHMQRTLEELRDDNRSIKVELSSLRTETTKIRVWMDEIRKREKQ